MILAGSDLGISGLFSSVVIIRKGHSEEMLSQNYHLLISADKFCLLVSLSDQKRAERQAG